MLSFNLKPVAVMKARSSDSDKTITVAGVTTANTTPANAANQINKLLGVAGKGVVADTSMTRTFTEGVVNNG